MESKQTDLLRATKGLCPGHFKNGDANKTFICSLVMKMKVFLLFIFFFVCFFTTDAQTINQQICVSEFFHDNGNSIIPLLAHPTCTSYKIEVRYDDIDTWYLVLEYRSGNEYFSCTYKILMNNGLFSSLQPIRCGSDDVACFEFCNLIKDFIAKTSQQDRDRYQRLMGKALDKMTCQDLCIASLYYRWIDKEYYRRFVNSE